MKKITAPLLLLAFSLMAFLPAGTDLTKKDRNNAVAYFKETKKFLKKEIAGLSEAQLNWKPVDSVWSIANCVEHIAVTEGGIFDWAMSTLKTTNDPSIDVSKKVTDEQVKAKLLDRSVKNKAPEMFVPTGRFGNAAESYAAFEKKRDSLIQYMKTTKDDLRGHVAASPLGIADTYQILLLLSGHTKRHTLQIVELKAMPGFPAK
ncbi:MAG: DinB family protein [Chitinophagaceae bacterium]|nr:MAG: DinB family protein [Chitinophagaceae bacterium]